MAQTQTNPRSRVAQIATQQGAMNTSGFNLLGVFGPENDMRALVRSSGGRVREIKRGERIAGGTVAAIDHKGLLVLQHGETRRLPMPGK